MGLADRAPRGWHYQPSGLITVCMPYGMDTMYPYLGRLWVHGTMARTHARTQGRIRPYDTAGEEDARPLAAAAAACGSRGGRAGGRAEKPAKTTPPLPSETAVPICQVGEQTRVTVIHRPASSMAKHRTGSLGTLRVACMTTWDSCTKRPGRRVV